MKNIKIMVVEDEILLQKVIIKKMQNKSIDTIACESGKQALEIIDKLKTSEELPDAIWLDYYLKGMNGLEFIHELRKRNLDKNIPIIVVTNSASEEKITSMLALGVKDYYLKAEHRLEDLVKSITDLIEVEKSY